MLHNNLQVDQKCTQMTFDIRMFKKYLPLAYQNINA